MNNQLTEKDEQVLMGILVRELGLPAEQIRGESRIMEDLGADSLTVIEITMGIEERFGLSIADERLEKVSTVDDLRSALAEALYPRACAT